MKKAAITAVLFMAVSLTAQSGPVWPQPPEKARIAYVKSISNAQDLGIKKGFFAKLWDFIAGSEEKKLIKPFGVHHDGSRLYVTDIGARAVFIFDEKRKSLKSIEHSTRFRFLSPIDVVTDRDRNIYVTDSTLNYVYKFNRNGKFIKKFGNDIRKRATAISYNEKKNLLVVTDTLAGDLKIFSTEGKFVGFIGKPGTKEGEFNRPTFTAYDDEGYLYVSDTLNHRVEIFDPEGKFYKSFGKLGNTVGTFSNPRGIAVDKNRNIYVVDTLFHSVQIFNENGDILLAFGTYGKNSGEFAVPEDITITKDGKIYITDSYNMRIQVFQILDYVQGGKK